MPSLRYDQNIFELQPLEIRRLLTTATIDPGNVLHVLGTGGADSITINRTSTGRITVTGVATQFNVGSAAGQINKILIEASGGNDTVLLTNNVRVLATGVGIPATIAGGTGNDTLTGGPASDVLSGNDGNDMLDGGGGNDEFTGGANFDTANYSTRTGAIDVDIDNIADDGEGAVGENDNVTTSMEEVIGGAGNDTLVGSGNADYFGGGGGNDSMSGGSGNDQLTGSAGQDKFFGQNGNDFLVAQNSDQDTVNGGTNSDGTADTDLASIDAIDVAAAVAHVNSLAAAAAAAGGPSGPTLDASYDADGRAVGPGDLGWSPTATAIDAQGRVYFVGTDFRSNGEANGQDIVVARFTSAGAFDTTFGVNGVADVDFTFFNGTGSGYNDDESGEGITVDADGNIIVVGSTAALFDNDSDFAIARLTPQGVLDSSFNDGGLQTVDIEGAGYSDEAFDVAVQADGKIVAVGEQLVFGSDSVTRRVAVARLTANGALDTDAVSPGSHFSTDGSQSYLVGPFGATVNAVALQPGDVGTERIVIAGAVDGAAALIRLTSGGTLDTGFGAGDGIDLQNFGGSAEYNDVTVNSRGNIVAVGNANATIIIGVDSVTPSGTGSVAGGIVAVFSPDADSLSSQFFPAAGQFGFISFNGVDTDADDRIIIAGAGNGDYVSARFRMVNGDNDGTPFENDDTFAPGLVYTDLSGDPESTQWDEGMGAFAMADGKIAIAGWSMVPPENITISAIRFLGSGGPVVPPNTEGDVTEVEEFIDYDGIHDPNTHLFDNVSAPARFYTLSQPDGDGVARIDIPPELDKANVVRVYNVLAGDGQINVAVDVDGLVMYYDPDDMTRIEIYTKKFNDSVTADNNVAVPLLIDAGEGNDNVTGGGEDDVILAGTGNDYVNGNNGDDAVSGGDGNDNMLGWLGNDILIGGRGSDLMFGYFGDNILIAGFTSHDSNVDALDALIAEWTSGGPSATRVNHIRNGGGLNDPYKLRVGVGATVFDDGASDYLTLGGTGDWAFYKQNGSNRDSLVAGSPSIKDFL